jgi:fatty acid desaturase
MPMFPYPQGWACYHCRMFNFGKPKTAGDWIVHIAGAIVAIFLVWWMLRVYVL